MSTNPKLLRLPDVIALTRLSRSTLYRLMDRGAFPRPVSVAGTRIRAWSAEAISAWIDDQLNPRKGHHPYDPSQHNIGGGDRNARTTSSPANLEGTELAFYYNLAEYGSLCPQGCV